jgi:hypothetical protein
MRDHLRLGLATVAVALLVLTSAGCGETVAEATEEGSGLLAEALTEGTQDLGEVVDLGGAVTELDGGVSAALQGDGTPGLLDVHPGTDEAPAVPVTIEAATNVSDGTALASADVQVSDTPVEVSRPTYTADPDEFVGPPAPSVLPASENAVASILAGGDPSVELPPTGSGGPPPVASPPPVAAQPAEDLPWWQSAWNTATGTYDSAVSHTTDLFEEHMPTVEGTYHQAVENTADLFQEMDERGVHTTLVDNTAEFFQDVDDYSTGVGERWDETFGRDTGPYSPPQPYDYDPYEVATQRGATDIAADHLDSSFRPGGGPSIAEM